MARALNILLVFMLLVASVGAQAAGLTVVALPLFVIALLAIAPLVNPATGL